MPTLVAACLVIFIFSLGFYFVWKEWRFDSPTPPIPPTDLAPVESPPSAVKVTFIHTPVNATVTVEMKESLGVSAFLEGDLLILQWAEHGKGQRMEIPLGWTPLTLPVVQQSSLHVYEIYVDAPPPQERR